MPWEQDTLRAETDQGALASCWLVKVCLREWNEEDHAERDAGEQAVWSIMRGSSSAGRSAMKNLRRPCVCGKS